MKTPDIESGNELRDRIVGDHVFRTVWWLAWPSLIALLLQTANGLMDAVFVGKLGAAALSGVGLASQIMFVLSAVANAVSIGATALIARFIGANEHKNAETAIRQSIIVSVILSLASGFCIYLAGPWLMKVMGAKGDDLHLGVTYLNILLLGVTPYFFMIVLTGAFRGVGDMRTPLWVMLAVTVIALGGDYLLIFGVGPFPKLGVVGAAIATVTSRVVATVLFFYYMPKIGIPKVFRGSWRPSFDWAARIMRIGTPVGIQFLLRTGGMMAFFAVLRRTPEALFATAALTIGLRMEALAFMPGLAFSVAATSMVGQNLGAKKPDRAEASAWSATWQGIGVTGVLGLMFILFAYPIARVFTNYPDVLPLAAQYLQLNGISEPFLALSMVLTGALQGAGETRLPAWATIATQWVFRLPFTYLLAVTLREGAFGAWVSMSVTTILGGLVVLYIFKISKWKEMMV